MKLKHNAYWLKKKRFEFGCRSSDLPDWKKNKLPNLLCPPPIFTLHQQWFKACTKCISTPHLNQVLIMEAWISSPLDFYLLGTDTYVTGWICHLRPWNLLCLNKMPYNLLLMHQHETQSSNIDDVNYLHRLIISKVESEIIEYDVRNWIFLQFAKDALFLNYQYLWQKLFQSITSFSLIGKDYCDLHVIFLNWCISTFFVWITLISLVGI